MSGYVLQFKNPVTGKYEDFQTYRTQKARREAKKILEESTIDKYRYKRTEVL